MSRTSPVFRLIHSTGHAVAAIQTTQSPTTEPDNYKGTMSRTSPVFRLIHMHTLQRPDKEPSRQLPNLIDTHAHAAAAGQRTQSSTTEPGNYNGTMSRTSPVFRLITCTAHAVAARQTSQSPTTEPGNYNETMSRTSPVFRLIHMHSTRCSGQTNNTVANYGTCCSGQTNNTVANYGTCNYNETSHDVSRIQIDTQAQHTQQRPDKQHSRQLRNLVTTTRQCHGRLPYSD
ncbi:hypothetical protein J6590_047947 [Homalodisca vitripennis]|nr:hypothetical protein J6590_047947 [Homalodisca vitripennis]